MAENYIDVYHATTLAEDATASSVNIEKARITQGTEKLVVVKISANIAEEHSTVVNGFIDLSSSKYWQVIGKKLIRNNAEIDMGKDLVFVQVSDAKKVGHIKISIPATVNGGIALAADDLLLIKLVSYVYIE